MSSGISPMYASTSPIMSGMTLPRMPGARYGNISGIIFSMRHRPPGTCFMARIIGFMPMGIASIICGKISRHELRHVLRLACRMMNLSK